MQSSGQGAVAACITVGLPSENILPQAQRHRVWMLKCYMGIISLRCPSKTWWKQLAKGV